MTDNMKYIVNTVTSMINSKFGDELPTIEDIHTEAETIRTAFSAIYPVTDEEFAQIKITLSSNILHSMEWQLHCVVVILHTSRGILFRKMMGSIGTDIRII